MRALFALVLLVVGFVQGPPATADVPHPPIEAYGELPAMRAFTISPDGAYVAFLARRDGKDIVVLYTRSSGQLKPLLTVDKVSARSLYFADDKHLVLIASDTTQYLGFRTKWEDSAAFTINTETAELKVLLRPIEGLYPAQSGLGKIVGRYPRQDRLFMPAFMGDRGDTPRYHLFTVNPDTGLGGVFRKGGVSTIDWFVDEDGKLMAREDYSEETGFYQIVSDVPGKGKTVYSTTAKRIPIQLLGVKKDKSALVIVDHSDSDEGYSAVYEMDFAGNLSAPVFARDDADIEFIYMDGNRFVEGVRYSGNVPSYDFYDPDIDAAVQEMMDLIPGAPVRVVDWSEGWKQILYHVFAGDTAGTYILQDRETGGFSIIANERDSIPAEAIGEVTAIRYKSRDGLSIPAILTWPAGTSAETRKNLPMIVMPHGGPASYSELGFDWWAQYFANRGYLVLEPNFRGSSGYGEAFERAGDHEWGLRMQDDITDGVQALIRGGMADADRVCIAGASYGGYAALAGGAFTPDLYKCVVAVAPVSDLNRWVRDAKYEYGSRSSVVDYWKRVIGDDSEQQKRTSPVNFADAFAAPVLLIHGREDTVVPISHSRAMEEALKRAGKTVTLVEMKGEDHWLSDGDTRKEALRAMSDFIDARIGQP